MNTNLTEIDRDDMLREAEDLLNEHLWSLGCTIPPARLEKAMILIQKARAIAPFYQHPTSGGGGQPMRVGIQ